MILQSTQSLDSTFHKFEAVFRKFPAPLIHNKRLGEILFTMMIQMPGMKKKYTRPAQLEIVTAHNYAEMSLFEKSLAYLGIDDFTVLQEHVDGPWRNTLKLKWVKKYLESNRHGPDLVLFCDADDTVLIDDPKKILYTFRRKKCKLLFMSTSFAGGYACMPDVKQWTDRLFPGRYLNSGVYVGERQFLLNVLIEAHKYMTDHDITAEQSRLLGHGVFNTALCRKLPDFPKGSQDQDILRFIHPRFYPDMQIDSNNELAFRNM